MITRSIGLYAVSGLVSLLLSAVAVAQTEDVDWLMALWCDPSEYQYDDSHPLALDMSSEKVRQPLTAGRWKEVDEDIVRKFDKHLAGQVLSEDTREFRSALYYYLSESIQRPARWLPEEPGGDELKYALPLDSATLPAPVKVDCDDIAYSAEAAAVAYTAVALYRVAGEGLGEAMKVSAAKLTDVYQTHRDRLFNGLPMWPWEMWVNGVGERAIRTNPRTASRNQWIVLRPGVSPAFKFDGNEDSEIDAGFVLEPFGYVRYLEADYSRWIGVSPIVTITNSNGIGYGATARYGNWTLGAAHHDKDSDTLLYVSVDLHDLVMGEGSRTGSAESFLDKLALKIADTGGQ